MSARLAYFASARPRSVASKHARSLVTEGLLTGPIVRSTCDPVGGGRDDLEAHTGRYECLAVNEDHDDGTYSGYSYQGTINYDEGTYSWRLGNE